MYPKLTWWARIGSIFSVAGTHRSVGNPIPVLDKRWRNCAEKKHQIDIDKIIEIDVEEEILIQRITTRALETNNSRDDDNSNVLKNRIEIYKKDTKPVLNFYSNMEKLITINGMLSIDEVSKEILNSLWKV